MVTLIRPVPSIAVVTLFAMSVSLVTQLIDELPGHEASALEYRPRKPAPSVAVAVRVHKMPVAPLGTRTLPAPMGPTATVVTGTTRSAGPNACLLSASREAYTL